MRWALSPSSQLGACAWKRWASSHVSGGMPPRQGVHVFSARVSLMYLSPRQFLARKATAGERNSASKLVSKQNYQLLAPLSIWFRNAIIALRGRHVSTRNGRASGAGGAAGTGRGL